MGHRTEHIELKIMAGASTKRIQDAYKKRRNNWFKKLAYTTGTLDHAEVLRFLESALNKMPERPPLAEGQPSHFIVVVYDEHARRVKCWPQLQCGSGRSYWGLS